MMPEDLRAFRDRLGLTQAELARLLDVPDSTVSRWERGLMSIASPTILRLALERLETREHRAKRAGTGSSPEVDTLTNMSRERSTR